MLRAGVPPWEAASALGMSLQVLISTDIIIPIGRRTQQMHDDMIDRVARALCKTEHEGDAGAWENKEDYQREDYRAEARAAIEAMREPTEAMYKAARAYGFSDGEALHCWKEMLDAALNYRSVTVENQAIDK